MSTKDIAVLLRGSDSASVQMFLERMEHSLQSTTWHRDKRFTLDYAVKPWIGFMNDYESEEEFRRSSTTEPTPLREAAPPPAEIQAAEGKGPSRSPSLRSAFDDGGRAEFLWRKLQKEVFAFIINSVKDNTIFKMLNRKFNEKEEAALGAWYELKQLVAQTSAASVQSLYEKFSKMKQEKGQPILDYTEALLTIVDQLEGIGEKLSSNFILAQFHSGLQPEYFSPALICKNLGSNLEKTKLELHNFETTVLSKKAKKGLGFGEEESDKGMAAQGGGGGRGSAHGGNQGRGGRGGRGRGQSHGGGNNGRGGGGGSHQPSSNHGGGGSGGNHQPSSNQGAGGGNSFNGICFACGEHGHKSSECDKRHPASIGHAKSSKSEPLQEVAMRSSSLNVEGEICLVDGAASKNMFNGLQYFENGHTWELTEEQSEREKVQLADQSFAYPTHRGVVEIEVYGYAAEDVQVSERQGFEVSSGSKRDWRRVKLKGFLFPKLQNLISQGRGFDSGLLEMLPGSTSPNDGLSMGDVLVEYLDSNATFPFKMRPLAANKLEEVAMPAVAMATISPVEIFHRQCGHASIHSLIKLKTNGLMTGIKVSEEELKNAKINYAMQIFELVEWRGDRAP